MAASAKRELRIPLAVTRGCRRIVVGGGPDYKNVWFFYGNGHAAFHLATPGTPESIAASWRGDLIAIGTAAGHLLLAEPDGRLIRDVKDSEDWGVLDSLTFSPDDTLILPLTTIGRAGLFTREGETVWWRDGLFNRVWPSRDWERFAFLAVPMHGMGYGQVQIIARNGEPIGGSDGVLDPIIQMAPDGSTFVISQDAQEFKRAVKFDPTLTETPPTAIDCDGNALSFWNPDLPSVGATDSCGPSGFDIVCWNREGDGVWKVSLASEHHLSFSSDLRLIALSTEGGQVSGSSALRVYASSRVP